MGKARLALEDTYAMDEAVRVVMEMTSSDDTLVVVTADHSHSFTSGGYTLRGEDILGKTTLNRFHGLPFSVNIHLIQDQIVYESSQCGVLGNRIRCA